MLIDLIIGLNGIMLLLMLTVLVKQFTSSGRLSQFSLDIKAQISNIHQAITQSTQQGKELLVHQLNQLHYQFIEKLNQSQLDQTQQGSSLREQIQLIFAEHRTRFEERQLETLKLLQDTLNQNNLAQRQQVTESLVEYANNMGKRVEQLTQTTEQKLNEINQQVEKRLVDGFVKTNETFHDVIKRLALIDAAQQKITELSSNVVSLQDLLNDKRSRGAFGEIQLSGLITNMIPEQHYSFQHTLSNHKRPDCMLFLPEPTGNIAIDAKFPLESFKTFIDSDFSEAERTSSYKQFKLDIKKHIQDISEKYIIPGETTDGAVMFIPAEAIFSEIHARHPDLVELAQKSKVWLVSPTTMMAILTTARAVLKDAATRKQVHEIQQHLGALSSDFDRFQLRMDNLAKRIAQAHADVEQVHISSRKISQRFAQIESVEMTPSTQATLHEPSLIQGQVKFSTDEAIVE